MKTEGVLGLIGGIFGLLGSMLVLFLSVFDDVLILTGLGGILCGAVAIVGAVLCKKRPHTGGALMLLSVVAGLYLTVWAYLIAAVLLTIAGVMCLRKGDKLIEDEESTLDS